jgi:hypothetical protein
MNECILGHSVVSPIIYGKFGVQLIVIAVSFPDSLCLPSSDLKGKIVEAVSISGLGACQLQWHELLLNGVDFLNDPKQVGVLILNLSAGRLDTFLVTGTACIVIVIF